MVFEFWIINGGLWNFYLFGKIIFWVLGGEPGSAEKQSFAECRVTSFEDQNLISHVGNTIATKGAKK